MCASCLAAYEEALESSQVCMELKADTTANCRGSADATNRAYIAAVCYKGDQAEILEVLGRQAAHVVKDCDPATSLNNPVACEAMLSEYRRLDKALDVTVELSSIPENAIVVKAKMLLGIKNWEDPPNRKPKARMVAMGNVLYNKHMAVIKSGDLSDLWAPVATLTGVRVVEARAAAHKAHNGH